MTAYATKADVYKYGLARGALGNPGRIVASALAATSTIELEEHGFSPGDAVTFRITQGGTLASPLVSGTTYYALPVDDSFFQVSATAGGSPITLTTDGVSMIVTADLPFDDLLEYYSRFVDGFLPAHVVPLIAPYPVTIVALVATLTAKRAQILSGVMSGSMEEIEAGAAKQLERFAKGIPVRDIPKAQKPANLSIVTSTPQGRLGIFPRKEFGDDDMRWFPGQKCAPAPGQSPWEQPVNAADNPLLNVETVTFDLVDNGTANGTATIDWSKGQKQRITLASNVVFSFLPPPGVANFLLEVTQDATGGRTVTWPATCKFPNRTAPTLSSAPGSIDIFSIFFDGASYFVGMTPNWG